MIRCIQLLLFTGFLFSAVSEHDMHISVMEISWNKQKIEITIKTFLDDLQLAVGLTPGEELPEAYSSSDELIQSYLKQKIKIECEGLPVIFQLREVYAGPNAVWISLSSQEDFDVSPSALKLKTDFMTELYKDQTNLIQFRLANGKKDIILNKKKTLAEYDNSR